MNAESSAEKFVQFIKTYEFYVRLMTTMNKLAPEIERLQYEQDAELEQIYLLQCHSMGQWLLEKTDEISDPVGFGCDFLIFYFP